MVAALVVVGVASAVDATQAIDVKLTRNKAGTKSKPRSIGRLNVLTTTAPGAGSPAGTFATQKATIFFDKNLVFNGKAFKECKPSNKSAPAGPDVRAKCASAKVGAGKAAGQATVGGQENLIVTAYNGAAKANGDRWFYLNVQGFSPPSPLRSNGHRGHPDARQRRLRRQARRADPAEPDPAARGHHRDAAELLDLGRRDRQGRPLRRPEGLLGRQAEVQGHVPLHRQHQQDGHRHGRLQEVGLRAPGRAAWPAPRSSRADEARVGHTARLMVPPGRRLALLSFAMVVAAWMVLQALTGVELGLLYLAPALLLLAPLAMGLYVGESRLAELADRSRPAPGPAGRPAAAAAQLRARHAARRASRGRLAGQAPAPGERGVAHRVGTRTPVGERVSFPFTVQSPEVPCLAISVSSCSVWPCSSWSSPSSSSVPAARGLDQERRADHRGGAGRQAGRWRQGRHVQEGRHRRSDRQERHRRRGPLPRLRRPQGRGQGRLGALRVPGEIEGKFIVELEEHKQTLANVTVAP